MEELTRRRALGGNVKAPCGATRKAFGLVFNTVKTVARWPEIARALHVPVTELLE